MKITLNEAINYFDEQCPNQYSQENKIRWISELDELIYNKIIKVREQPAITEFVPYTEQDLHKELIVDTPYTEIYRYWLEKSVDYSNREMNAYNNALAMFKSYYDEFFAEYSRTHRTRSDNQRWHIG